jgi:hypothetical protein
MSESSFEQRLRLARFPHELGDVALRYEHSLFVVETKAKPKGWGAWVILFCGLTLAVLAIAALMSAQPLSMVAVPTALSGACACFHRVVVSRQNQRRRFVLDFETRRLKVDSMSRWLALPLTRWLDFDDVKGIELVSAPQQLKLLTIRFALIEAPGTHLEEVVAVAQHNELDGLLQVQTFLVNAFGLQIDNVRNDSIQPDIV